jgi:hypothetical protein
VDAVAADANNSTWRAGCDGTKGVSVAGCTNTVLVGGGGTLVLVGTPGTLVLVGGGGTVVFVGTPGAEVSVGSCGAEVSVGSCGALVFVGGAVVSDGPVLVGDGVRVARWKAGALGGLTMLSVVA